MDPLSIATGCAGLITAIGGLSMSIHTFVRTCREARGDLDSVSRELLSLKTILELIKEDASDEKKPFPTTLNQHVKAILANCNLVVIEIQTCITKYSQDRLKTRIAWAINGQGDINKLRSSLEAHKTALEIALDMLALHLTKEIKNDTTEIRNDTTAIKEDTAQILEEIARLQARLPRDAAAAASNDFILQRFFEEMTTYTEKALDAARSDVDADSSKALSFDEEPEERPAALLQQTSWPYHSMTSSFQQSSRVESGISNGIQNPYRDSEAASDTSSPSFVDVYDGVREDYFIQRHDSYDQEADKSASTEHRGISGFEIPLDEEVVEQARCHGLEFTSREFTHRRYSTLTCSNEEFQNLDFTFRLVGFEPPRQIKIILLFRLYPSDDLLSFNKRWDFLVSSICHLRERTRASVPDPWKDILVHVACFASLDQIDPSIRESLYKMGILNTPTAASTNTTPTKLTTGDKVKPNGSKSSYSIPEEGTPVSIAARCEASKSHPSLIIEYFEPDKHTSGSASERRLSRRTPFRIDHHAEIPESKGTHKSSITRRKPLDLPHVDYEEDGDREPATPRTIQAEIFEYTTHAPLCAAAGGKSRPFSITAIQVVLTAYRNDSCFRMSIGEAIYAHTGWYHSLCALLGAGMIIEVPNEASGISERDSGYQNQEFLYEAWANKRDISGLRTYNCITATSLMMYLSMRRREKPKPKSILSKILDRFAA